MGERLLTENNRAGGTVSVAIPRSWKWLRYDARDDNSFYRRQILPAQGIKAVDFLVSNDQGEMWIEVKDYRGSPVDLGPRFSEEPTPKDQEAKAYLERESKFSDYVVRPKNPWLGEELAAKVRDTVLGLTAAQRTDDPELRSFARGLIDRRRILVVLVLESDHFPDEFKRLASRLQTKLESRLRFLDEVELRVVNEKVGSGAANWRIETTPNDQEPKGRANPVPKAGSAKEKPGKSHRRKR